MTPMLPIYKSRFNPKAFAMDLGAVSYIGYMGPKYECCIYTKHGKHINNMPHDTIYTKSSWFELLVVHGVTWEMFKKQYEAESGW